MLAPSAVVRALTVQLFELAALVVSTRYIPTDPESQTTPSLLVLMTGVARLEVALSTIWQLALPMVPTNLKPPVEDPLAVTAGFVRFWPVGLLDCTAAEETVDMVGEFWG